MKKWLPGNVFAGALLVCLMTLIALTAMGEGIKIPTIWPPRTLPQTPAQNGDSPSAWKDRIVEVKDADINPCPDRPNCYEVVFSLESKVANTNVWVDFTAYSEDNFPFFIGDSISFDSCQSYTNEIVVAVGPDGKSGTVTFIWDRGRYNRAVHGIPETPVHHAVIEAR